jgi:hypothetical protein
VNRLLPWTPPADLDPECYDLCVALNKIPSIRTTESCCGHGEHAYVIFFQSRTMKSLIPLLYWIDGCHSGRYGWQVIVSTDCGCSGPFFRLEGPKGEQAYDDAKHIAGLIRQEFR